MNSDVYRCPKCSCVRLSLIRGSLFCSGCSTQFPVTESVPDFGGEARPPTSARYPDVEARLQKLVSLSAAGDWYEALSASFDVGSVSYGTDERKADFIYLLDLEPSARVLDLGCGVGPITMALAHEYAEVYALDAIREQVLFVSRRARQSGCPNVYCASGGGDLVLPFRDSLFDLVVMNGVLEWVGNSRTTYGLTPAECQRKMLKEVHRVLKRGGRLYISTKNRFALRYLTGDIDEHTGLPFTSMLPFRVARSLRKLFKRREYRVGLLSAQSLGRIAQAVGFERIDLWSVIPDFRFPCAYVDSEDKALLKFAHSIRAGFGGFPKREDLLYRMLPFQALRYLPYCFATVARKGDQS